MSAESIERARKIVQENGGICLVPKSGRGGISCHEKTFCDCKVESMIAEALDTAKAEQREVDAKIAENDNVEHLDSGGEEISCGAGERIADAIRHQNTGRGE